MNNKIEPIYVSFEQAKWLADKKFLVHTKYGYTKNGLLERPYYGETYINSDFENSLTYSAPEQWQVVEWLRVNHNVHVRYTVEIVGTDEWMYGYNILYLPFEFKDAKRRCPHMVEINSFKEGSGSYLGAWDTPQAAYLAAIDYIKDNNLI